MSVEGQLIWFGTVGNVSTDCSWHARTRRLRSHTHTQTMGPSLYQGREINNSGEGERQGGDVKCAALNVFTHRLLTDAE